MSNTINRFNNTTTFTKSFVCPVERCGKCIDENTRQIADHIRRAHPVIAKKIGLISNPEKRAFICYHCNSYTAKVHHHCFECEHPENGGKMRYFSTAEARNEHLKQDHAKWWFEYGCKYGVECRGKKGGCGFNHNIYEQSFITNIAEIPFGICRYDTPWDGKRCMREKCSFSHFWGRVRFLIKMRATKSESICTDCCSSSEIVANADAANADAANADAANADAEIVANADAEIAANAVVEIIGKI